MQQQPELPFGRSKTLREHFRDGLIAAHKRRPVSFYLLLIIPIVLLLGLQMAQYRDDPRRFAMVLALLFVFCGVTLFLAVADIFSIARKQMREHREMFRETLGAEELFRKSANTDDEPGGE